MYLPKSDFLLSESPPAIGLAQYPFLCFYAHSGPLCPPRPLARLLHAPAQPREIAEGAVDPVALSREELLGAAVQFFVGT